MTRTFAAFTCAVLLGALVASCRSDQEKHHAAIEAAWRERVARTAEVPDDERRSRIRVLEQFLAEYPASHAHGNPRAAEVQGELDRLEGEIAAEEKEEREEREKIRAKIAPLLEPYLTSTGGEEHPLDPRPLEPMVMTLDGVDYRTRSRWSFRASVASYDGAPMEDVNVLSKIVGAKLYRARRGLDTDKLIWLLARLDVEPEDEVLGEVTAAQVWPFFAPSLRHELRLAHGAQRLAELGVIEADLAQPDGRIARGVDVNDYFDRAANEPPNAICLRMQMGLRCDWGPGLAFWARRAQDGTLAAAIEAMERILTSMGGDDFVDETGRLAASFQPLPETVERDPDAEGDDQDHGETYGEENDEGYGEELEEGDSWFGGFDLPTTARIADIHSQVPERFRTRGGERVTLSAPERDENAGWSFMATTQDDVALRVPIGALAVYPRRPLTPERPFAQDGLLTVPSEPIALAFSPDGDRLALLDNRGKRLRVLEVDSGETSWTVSIGERGEDGSALTWAPDSAAVYALTNSGYRDVPSRVLRLPADGSRVDEVLKLDDQHHGRIATTGGWVVVDRTSSSAPAVLAYHRAAAAPPAADAKLRAPSAEAGAEKATPPTEHLIDGLDGSSTTHPTLPLVAAPIKGGSLVILNLTNGERRTLKRAGNPAFSRDGKWLAVGEQIFALDAQGFPEPDGRRLAKAKPKGEKDWSPVRLATGGDRLVRASHWVARVHALGSNELLRVVSGGRPLTLSPDGKTLVTTDGIDLQIWKLP